MFIFGVPSDKINTTSSRLQWVLHCGDFRAHRSILNQTLIYLERNNSSEISRTSRTETEETEETLHFKDFLFDSVYLDTTYANEKYTFPPQDLVIDACIHGCGRLLSGNYDPARQKRLVPLKWLIVVGSYLIGKERIILAVAEAFDLLIFADSRKRTILNLLNWPQLSKRLTDDPTATPLHLVSMSLLSKQKLSDYRDSFNGHFSHILGIRPTGWTFSSDPSASASSAAAADVNDNEDEYSLKMPQLSGNAGIWPVPYSEHSSFMELKEFLRSISVYKIIPTVENYSNVVLDTRAVGGNSDILLYQWAKSKEKNKKPYYK